MLVDIALLPSTRFSDRKFSPIGSCYPVFSRDGHRDRGSIKDENDKCRSKGILVVHGGTKARRYELERPKDNICRNNISRLVRV